MKTIIKIISVLLTTNMLFTGCSAKTKGEQNTKMNSQVAAVTSKTQNNGELLSQVTPQENKTPQNASTETAQNASPEAPKNASTGVSQQKKNSSQNTSSQKVATPTTQSGTVKPKNKVIVIDPGHANKSNLTLEALAPGSSVMKIKDGGGAEGIVTHTPEYLINMRVGLKLRNLLQHMGYTVVMTKTDNSLSLGNIERANIWNKANASLVIRIHADSADNSSVMGASMLVPAVVNNNTKAIYSESKRCGSIVLNTLTKEVGMHNRGVTEHSDMTGFNWSKVPVILVEMGFLSNPGEDKLLSSDAYENKLAKGLADGIAAAEK